MASRRSSPEVEGLNGTDELLPIKDENNGNVIAEPQRLPDISKNESLDISKNESLDDHAFDINFDITQLPNDGPDAIRNKEIIAHSAPSTELEHALKAELDRQIQHNELLVGECTKLRGFISKRKQTYKRKRKDESAPRKKLSGYNLFVRERFAKIAQANEDALKNADSGAELKRIPPASNIASSGHAWSQLSAEEKARYNEMAKPDEDRFQKETADYTAPEKLNRKRAKTGYNVFFSKHVLELKQNDGGVPSERGSVARIVGDAWKKMSAEEKDEYERQADQQNEMTHSDAAEHPQHPLQHAPSPHHPHHPPPPHMIVNGMAGGPPPGGPLPPPHLDAMGPPPPGPGPPPEQMRPHPPMDEHGRPPPGAPMDDGGPPPPGGPGDPILGPPVDPGMPPPYPDYGMHGPPPPVIHQPPGYEHYGPYPPFDPYAYPPNYQGGPPPPPYPPGMPLPPGYGPPPPNYQGPPPPYV